MTTKLLALMASWDTKTGVRVVEGEEIFEKVVDKTNRMRAKRKKNIIGYQ